MVLRKFKIHFIRKISILILFDHHLNRINWNKYEPCHVCLFDRAGYVLKKKQLKNSKTRYLNNNVADENKNK